MRPPRRIVLCTLNARYSHSSFGLRYLLANLGPHRSRAVLREFTISQPPLQIAEQLLAEEPDLIGFGVYIWNVTEITAVMEVLRAVRPDLRLVIGGPEVSHEHEGAAIVQLADHLITGEADLAFRALIDALDDGQAPPRLIAAEPPDVRALRLPYDEYTDTDLRERILYVEASRGCPFRCEFCLSALDNGVRGFPLPEVLGALQRLLDRGARGFKFVDRTFNLSLPVSTAILSFCLERYRPGLELHFEMIPDRLPQELRELLRRFPPGAVQLEVGIQSFTPSVLRDISRPQRSDRIEENLRFLREETGVHVHADLIFGLPGETYASFAQSFNRLLALRPGEIQLGFLKRLRGTPIIRHTHAHGLRFSPRPPYEVLQTATVPFAQMQELKRLARYFDLYHNSGSFVACMELLFSTGEDRCEGFRAFAAWVYRQTGQTHQLALTRLCQLLFRYLVEVRGLDPGTVGEALLRDYDRHQVRRERLEFLRPYVPSVAPPAQRTGAAPPGKRRGRPPTQPADGPGAGAAAPAGSS